MANKNHSITQDEHRIETSDSSRGGMGGIKFAHSRTGRLKEIGAASCGSALMKLGALAHTETQSGEFATDLRGLETAHQWASSAACAFTINVQSIGQLLAYADIDNVEKKHIQDIGWLLTTLGENIQDLADLQVTLEDAIAKVSGKGAKP